MARPGLPHHVMKSKDKHARTQHAETHGKPSRRLHGARTHTAASAMYRKDAAYREVLELFQSAEWEACLRGLDKLLQAHPNDAHLRTFREEVELRFESQQQSDHHSQALDREQRRKGRQRRLIGISIAVVVMAGLAWIASAIRDENMQRDMAAAATQTAVALAAKQDLADTFMLAGRAEEALALYEEIKAVNRTYPRIEDLIQAAEHLVEVETLYQQGVTAMGAGDPEQALEFLERADALEENYKDTPQLIVQIHRETQIAGLLQDLDEAYERGDSQVVVDRYESILALDPTFDDAVVDDELFASYQELVFESAARPDLSPEEIEAAVGYYRKALALFPQSLEYARQREELQTVAIDLLASQYYLQGIDMLESSDYSLEGLEEAILVLQRARERAPGSRLVDATIEKAQAFIEAYQQLLNARWDEAIIGLESVYRRDPDFANGRARYFLYEAHRARGDILMQNADYGGALSDYQEAERLAFADEENVLRMFEIETRIGRALRRLGNPDQGAEFYHFAFAQLAFESRLTSPEQAALLQTIEDAEAAFEVGSPLGAIELYEEAVDRISELFELTRIDALRGDTLPNIAFDHGSTLASLLDANQLGEALVLSRSRELFVPIITPLQ